MKSALPTRSLLSDYLSKEESVFLLKIQEFGRDEVVPHADQWDKDEHLPREIFTRAGQLGLMGICVPKKPGGLGLSCVAYSCIIAELAKCSASLALDIAAHNALAVGHILGYCNDAQRRRMLPHLINGDWIAAWALTEPNAGSDSGGMETTATQTRQGWEITGRKIFITQGRRADILVIMAATGVTETGRKEISAFLVEKQQVQPVRKVHTCGMRASETSELRLDRARAELLGERGQGQAAALACLDKGRLGVASVSLGLGRYAADSAIRYMLNRRQFGKRLADFQALQFKLADAATQLDAAELLILHAAMMADRGNKHTTESAMAKLFASEAATRVCSDAMQIHGGSGYSRDLPIERCWRDARLCEIGEGTSEIQRMVISRNLLKAYEEALHPPAAEAVVAHNGHVAPPAPHRHQVALL